MAERKYTASHEWIVRDGDGATIGITDFAQAQLGDVVFLELPAKGAALKAGATFGVIESVKAASDLYSPVSGRVKAVNDALTQTPEAVNRDPYAGGWMLELELTDAPSGELLDEAGYTAFTEGL